MIKENRRCAPYQRQQPVTWTPIEVLESAELSGDRERIANAKFNIGNIYSDATATTEKPALITNPKPRGYRNLAKTRRRREIKQPLPRYVNSANVTKIWANFSQSPVLQPSPGCASEKPGNWTTAATHNNSIGTPYRDQKDWQTPWNFTKKALAVRPIGNEYASSKRNKTWRHFHGAGDLYRLTPFRKKA